MKDIAELLASRNSSITRVRPILREMLKSRPGGAARLRSLLNAAPGIANLPGEIREHPGTIITDCRRPKIVTDEKVLSMEVPGAFEWEVPPPGDFLRWLIEHPDALTKPEGAPVSDTDTLRAALLDRESEKHASVRNRALVNLNYFGAQGSRRQWWAFEGFTYVDCLIETESLVLFIEGKRTEESSPRVSWFSERNQIARNLECARQYALSGKKSKAFAVLMIIEEGVNEDYHRQSVEADTLLRSWPHYQETTEIHEELLQGFLGILTWDRVIDLWELDRDEYKPETVQEAMDRFFVKHR